MAPKRKPKLDKEPTVPLFVHVPASLYAWVVTHALASGYSRTAIVSRVLADARADEWTPAASLARGAKVKP